MQARPGDLGRYTKGTSQHSAYAAQPTPPLRDACPQGPPVTPPPRHRHLVVCSRPSRPATWRVAAEAEAPPQLPARPVPAGRGPQTRGCPLAAGCAPPRPALAISLPAGRTSAPRCVSLGRAQRRAPGAGRPCTQPWARTFPQGLNEGYQHLYTQFKQ